MKKIPFDISLREKVEQGKYTLETRDGRPAQILKWDAVNENYPLVGTVVTEGTEEPYSWTPEGRALLGDKEQSNSDLIVVGEDGLTRFEEELIRIMKEEGSPIGADTSRYTPQDIDAMHSYSERLMSTLRGPAGIKDGFYGLKADGTVVVPEDVGSDFERNYEGILIKNGHTCIVLSFYNSPEWKRFDEMQNLLKTLKRGYRCPTRHEWIDIYDMKFKGLDEFIRKLGIDRIDEGSFWTCEKDSDPIYSEYNSWMFDSVNGYLDSYPDSAAAKVRLVREWTGEDSQQNA